MDGSFSLRSRRLEVVGERENGRARGRHARGVSFSRARFFWCPLISYPDLTLFYSLYVSGKLPTYPSPKPAFRSKWEVSVIVGLGEE